MEETGAGQRALFRRWPSGVSIVAAESDRRRAGLTVSSLVSLSLVPGLVGISLAHVASLYEVLQEAGEWTVSILAGNQDRVARHFARSVPPLVQWNGIAVREDDPRLIADAVGWILARTTAEVAAGDHTFFVGEVVSLELGRAASSLVHLDRRYSAL